MAKDSYEVPNFKAGATGRSFQATGKTGATATPVMLAGGTLSGKPTTGAHIKGEVVVDDAGVFWYCTVAGTPGEWVAPRSLMDGAGTVVNTATAGEVKIDAAPDVQDFVAGGAANWTPPSWVVATSTVEVEVVGPGGTGGSGRRAAGSTMRGGGGGGASGNRSMMTFLYSDLTLIGGVIPIVVGAPGAGTANTTNDTDGIAGAAGTATSFGKYLVASAGGPGLGGTATDGGAGGTPGSRGRYPGLPGAQGGGINPAASLAAAGLFGSADALTSRGAGGGGQGTNASNVVKDPSAGGAANGYTDGSTAGGTAGVPGTSTAATAGATAGPFEASGGGGGQKNAAGTGIAGGAGGFPGGGGGGSGTSANGLNSAAGALGGGGRVRVVTRR